MLVLRAFFQLFSVNKKFWIFFSNILASALSCIIYSWENCKKILRKIIEIKLKHTQWNVCEKEELPCFLYLIQIFASTFVRLSGWMIDFYDKLPGERTRASFFGAPQRVMGVCKFIYHTSTQKCWTAWLQLQHGSLESSSSYTCFF